MRGKRLLITGGTGSFGNTVLSKFLNSDVKEIIVFSRDEEKQDRMRLEYGSSKLRFVVGDVRDASSIFNATKNVNFVFHAAALKQVPSCEFNPMEAVKTNILGTSNLLDACVNNGVEKVVCLSTDKAAHPVNAMGISKALMEKVVIAKARDIQGSGTILSVTRYGNVLNSRGSVVPLFLSRVRSGEHIPITHPKMTRFIMTLPEAVDLVQFAFNNAKGGEIFVQKSSACSVETLADAILRISGSNVEKKQIGVRHGEKMYEVLMTREEATRADDLGAFFRINPDFRYLNYHRTLDIDTHDFDAFNDYTSENTTQLGVQEVAQILLSIPEIAGTIAC